MERPTDSARPTETVEAPLCVDLDGTLIHTDLAVESLVALARRDPLALLLVPFWLLRGRAFLKDRIAARVALDIAGLPFNAPLIEELRAARARGRRLILVTAASRRYADAVARHLDLFDAVIASDAAFNCKGTGKRDTLLAEFGDRGFDYMGDSRADLRVWPHARQAVAVNAAPGVARAARRLGNARVASERAPADLRLYLRAMRPQQWLKNLLVFVPALAAHRYADAAVMGQAALAFIAMSLAASATYLLNDLLDLEADRGHPRKRLRPLASGAMPPASALVAIPAGIAAAFLLGAFLGAGFVAILALYVAVTTGYSLILKRIVMLDVLVLAGLYTLRVIAGAAATAVAPSFWLLAFSMFVFFSLALVKRYSELHTLQRSGGAHAAGRGYRVDDLPMLHAMGTAGAFVAVLVLALYVDSPNIQRLYEHPRLIWLVCPLFLYLMARVWLIAHRGGMHDDPLVFMLEDRVSLLILALCAGVALLAI